MLTKNEITSLSLSPTKKDFVQIWNELLEVAGKLSERWDPTSTNESDPGIVILKALTGIADKLNYNIDKNTLEAFMPTAAQEDSMRKLCDMLGYNIKYYQSAKTNVTIRYYATNADDNTKAAMANEGLGIPKFTVITNNDKDISYFTINPIPYNISATAPSLTIECMEGQIVKCESLNDNYVITHNQISETNRFYLPETQIAENGIFVYNVFNEGTELVDGTPWEKVDNLNTQARASRVFKFGFDSYEGRPYIEFPADYSELFNDGVFIYYTRTNGINGNVSPRTLTQIELPTTGKWSDVSAESFSVENVFSATTGANPETIKQAYNNFKKTVGTFETLVTCRDYMNKVYSLMDSEGKPYVSNVLVTDIRNDLNRAVTICSCDGAGIYYKEVPLKDDTGKQAIDHFNLVFYPFKSYSQIKNNVTNIRTVYDASFEYTDRYLQEIEAALDNNKTIAHTVISPRKGDIISINNYLRLSATIATSAKITNEEGTFLIEKIKIALANAFNMRELDFGEEIPFDSIVEVIENSDARIRIVSLNEPALYTTFSVFEHYADNTPVVAEYAVASDWLTAEEAKLADRFSTEQGPLGTFDTDAAKKIYNKLVVRNILAGRVSLFNYNETFKADFSESAYQVTDVSTEKPASWPDGFELQDGENCAIYTENDSVYTIHKTESGQPQYSKTYTKDDIYSNNLIAEADNNKITEIGSDCVISCEDGLLSGLALEAGEFIKFRAPNFITTKTYPAYVNYHLKLNNATLSEAEPAKASDLFNSLNSDWKDWSAENKNIKWQKVLDHFSRIEGGKQTFTISQKVSAYKPDGASSDDEPKKGEIVINAENTDLDITSLSMVDLLKESGCVKLVTSEYARVAWTPEDGESPSGSLPTINLKNFGNPFITSLSSYTELTTKIEEAIFECRTTAGLPETCTWTLSLDFEYVPFKASTLNLWEDFIKNNASQVLDFEPKIENGVVFWRMYGAGYDIGKYITIDSEKLLKFTKSQFELLSQDSYLKSIYLIEDLGKDASLAVIKNDEEYMLRKGEVLYIEYTPSTTTEDGTTQSAAAVTEIYEEGTIIRPSGFDVGLVDSSNTDTTLYKSITFMHQGSNPKQVAMQRFGANEQVEIRDYARVILDKNSFAQSAAINVYKNFNGCDALEENNGEAERTYTLKDNEYIFYTDENKAELAYFTSGTEVTLTGSTTIPKFDIIDINAIFDSGLREIPWKRVTFGNNDSIIFQEYQYVTLGQADELDVLTLVDKDSNQIDSNWRYCSGVEYRLASNKEKVLTLPTLDIHNADPKKGDGWEVSSIFALDVSRSNAQSLRNTDKVKTSLTLYSTSSGGQSIGDKKEGVTLLAAEGGGALSFKTNLTCQTNGSTLNINNISYNPSKLDHFELKVFKTEKPAIVKTVKGKLVPYPVGTLFTDLSSVNTENINIRTYKDMWNSVELENLVLKKEDEDKGFDYALRLPVSLLPDTYGIFCIYVDYSSDPTATMETWIELLPGTDKSTIKVLNSTLSDDKQWKSTSNYLEAPKLLLQPGINCIRVNNTCRLFIKTANSSTGTIYFDDLRLVNCRKVKHSFKDATGNTVDEYLPTHGLNMTQLGYMWTSDISDSITTTALCSLIYENISTTQTTINNISNEASAAIEASTDQLKMLKDKIENLIKIERAITADLQYVSDNISAETLEKLIARRDSLQTALDNEIGLLEALAANVNIDNAAQGLIEALGIYDEITTKQTELLNELEQLKAEIRHNIESVSETKILEDFASCLELRTVSDIDKTRLISAATDLIESDFDKQLVGLTATLDQLANSDDSNKLAQLLESLQMAKNADKYIKLRALISKITNIDQYLVTDTLNSLQAAVNKADYSAVLTDLYKLKAFVSDKDLTFLISELINMADEYDIEYLTELISQINSILNPGTDEPTEVTNAYNSINKTIDELITAVLGKLYTSGDLGTIDTSLVSRVNALCNGADGTVGIADVYTDELIANINAISAVLSELLHSSTDSSQDKSLLDHLNKLKGSKENEIARLTNKLSGVVETRANALDALATLSPEATDAADTWADWTKNLASEFIRSAIISYWPTKLLDRAELFISEVIDNKLTAAINFVEPLQADSTISTLFTKDTITDVFSALLNNAAIKLLITEIEALTEENSQYITDDKFIQEIGSLLPLSGTASQLMDDINDDDTSRNIIIRNIITELRSVKSVQQRQQLLERLTSELELAKTRDERLLNAISFVLYPSITKFEVSSDANDDFYENLCVKIETIKANINQDGPSTLVGIFNTTDSALDVLDAVYLNIFNNTTKTEYLAGLEAIKEASKEAINEEPISCMPKKVNTLVNELATAAAIALTATEVKEQFVSALQVLKELEEQNATAGELEETVLSKITVDGIEDPIKSIVGSLISEIEKWSKRANMTDGIHEALKIIEAEDQLLADIKRIDTERNFYYNAPIEDSLAIELNESNKARNTLLNPATNYDINNINNSFVISKLDIDYLTNGIQLARSSRLN